MTILVISPIPSHPQNAGNRARVYSLLKVLREMNYDVHFAHIQETLGDEQAMRKTWGNNYYAIPYTPPATTHKEFPKRIDQRLWRKVKATFGDDPRYNYQIDDWYDPAVDSILRKLNTSLQPDVVIVEYVFFSKAFDCFPQAKLKVIDTHDIFEGRYKLYHAQKKTPQWFSTNRKQEDKGLRRADKVLAIQDHEARVLERRVGTDRVVTVGHLVPVDQGHPQSGAKNLLFLGSSNPINVHAIEYFLKDIFPICKTEIPDICLILAGSIGQALGDYDNCLKLGEIDDLRTVYAQADIVINPILFGTGLKIKNIEALGFGKPLVTTSIGASGLENGVDSAFLVADTPEQFANHIINLCKDVCLREKLVGHATEFAQQWNAQSLDTLSEIINSATICNPSLCVI